MGPVWTEAKLWSLQNVRWVPVIREQARQNNDTDQAVEDDGSGHEPLPCQSTCGRTGEPAGSHRRLLTGQHTGSY